MNTTHKGTTDFFFKSLNKSLFVLKKQLRPFLPTRTTEIALYISSGKVLTTSIHLKLSTCLGAIPQSVDSSGTQLQNPSIFLITAIFFNLQKNYTLLLNWTFEDILGKLCFNSHTQDKIFFNYWWLEREIGELLGVFFEHKDDTRNLLLEYTNIFKPFLHFFPSYGLFELFYNTILQSIHHKYHTAQS